MLWFIVLIVVLGIVVFLPQIIEWRRIEIDRNKRKEAPGKFAELSQGLTHYRWMGPTRGPVAVMIHGLINSSPVWEDLGDTMVDLGYRVLVYDLYNRGYSDSVDGPHDTDMYLRQLDELLADQGLDDSLTLVGYSMGGMIATAFAATEPHRMQRLVLLAPGGVELTESDYGRFCRTTPVIGPWAHGVWAGMRMARIINEDAYAAANPHIFDTMATDLDRRGFLPGILACRSGILTEVQENAHRAITRDGIPTIAIWGENDGVVPSSAVGKMAQWNRKAHHEIIEGAGHELPYSHVAEVSDVLRKMLREQKTV